MHAPGAGSFQTGSTSVDKIKKIIIDSNPLMEAFGNAKTVRNDNSSRFGKYLEIQFDENSAPVGGVISTFLLEKTRVSFQQKKERNFHIFYNLLCGADAQLKNDLGINCDMSYFYYMAQSGCTSVEGVNDASDFREVTSAMDTIGMAPDEQTEVFRVLAAILHVGNIRFQGEPPATVVDNQPLESAAFLLGVDPQFLAQALNHRQIQTGSARSTQYNVPQNVDQASAIRDALAGCLYERVFDRLVAKLNRSMATSRFSNTFGILDIYGFEIFEQNSFEQFCINYVNERLQQIFIDLTVRGEQKEYHDEGMKWKDIDFFDNKIVCELVDASRPPGIMRVLDDVCRTVHAVDSDTADTKFLEKLNNACGSHAHCHVSPAVRQFTIKHYAGDVTYEVSEFVFKNKDNLYGSIVTCMQLSTNEWVLGLFPENLADNKSAPTTAGSKIRTSANELVKRLSACTPHYIRCIKPNDKKEPMCFTNARVEHQVKYLGLLENVKVKRAGYAYRHFTSVFLDRYGQLCDTPPASISEFTGFVGRKFKDINVAEEFEEGKTKIFIKSPETIFILEDALYLKLDPEGYKEKTKAFKENEKLAQSKQAKHSLKPKCVVM
eukprot:TRINITY_DN445_c0_g1_i1.p1 TRINITY_DN445_c0_g1~~TRINITY_DN445_c0_g1_i1.p1  ORF type:complete len:606 (-),score=158.16 TRINITY_DN445_c0_g1_i1:126-1943(-)